MELRKSAILINIFNEMNMDSSIWWTFWIIWMSCWSPSYVSALHHKILRHCIVSGINILSSGSLLQEITSNFKQISYFYFKVQLFSPTMTVLFPRPIPESQFLRLFSLPRKGLPNMRYYEEKYSTSTQEWGNHSSLTMASHRTHGLLH